MGDSTRRRAVLVAGAALCFLASTASGAEDLVIAEILASNESGLVDEDGDRSDWIEVQNLGPAAVDIGGWFLTDDPQTLARWPFPSRRLAPGDVLLVFASGKDRRPVSGPLHASFKLSREPGFLALVRPDGRTIAHSHEYPAQRDDVSYGLPQPSAASALIAAGASCRYLVPRDGALGLSWTGRDFVDAAWRSASTGLGFDLVEPPGGAGDGENLARAGTARQSTTGYGGVAARANDGNTDGNYGGGSVSHTADGDPSPLWEVDLGSVRRVGRIVLWNRTDCCPTRLSNFRVSVFTDPEAESFAADFFTDGQGYPPPGAGFPIVLPDGVVGRFVRVELLGPNSTGEHYLSLAEVQVFGGPPSFHDLLGADLEGEMRGVNASLYARIAFDVADPGAVDLLVLRMKHDDGFIAYLNGAETARRNAPPAASWSSAAPADRPRVDALAFEEVNLTESRGLLQAGRNVLALHGLNRAADDLDFLLLPELRAASVDVLPPAFFLVPTPGALNDPAGVGGFVADTQFSVDRGFFSGPFDVAITCETPGAEIRTTLDGSEPTRASGLLHTAPLRIERTTILRAAAFKDGMASSGVDTQTYIFPAQVVRQTGAGFPSTWGGTAADYAMDPEVVDHPAYRDTVADDIISTIPTLSIVLDRNDLFGPSGIYSNPEGRGDAWERACSMELIYPDPAAAPEGLSGFQIDCGLRIYGFGWRSHSASLKHAFRLMFKRKYGAARLEHPFFPDWPVDRFDGIVLRSQGSRGWNDFRTSIEQTCYIRDAWARYTERDMGKLGTSSTHVHLFLNGLYWGLYNPVERPDAEFMAEHVGGREEDYHALNARVGSIEVIDGSRAEWDALMALARGDVTTLPAWEMVQESLDAPDLVDYMLINFYTANQDWTGSNGNNMRVAGAPALGVGFKSFCWDMEYSIWNATDNVLNVLTGYDTPAALHARLRTSAEYRMLFADRAHRHLTGTGALSPERAAARWEMLAERIEGAVVGESARWGDRRREPPYTRDVEWMRERNRLLTSYFPQRAAILLQQLAGAGLYPPVAAPEFNQPGGPIDPRFVVTLSAPGGELLYALDGADPRLPGGAVSPEAIVAGGGGGEMLVASSAPARALIPVDGSLGLSWTATDFDDLSWTAGTTGAGYETTTGYEDLIGLDLSAAFRVNPGFYLRVEFQAAAPLPAGDLVLRMKYDDGFVAYLNGTRVAAKNEPADPIWSSAATASNDDARAVVFERFELPGAAAHLRAGKNVLAIHGLNQSAASGDLLILPELASSGTGAGTGPTLTRTTTVRARAREGATWSALAEATFVVDSSAVRITEVHYHPAPPLPESPFTSEDFEFLELQNTGDVPLNLEGMRLSGAVELTFRNFLGAAGDLAPGAFVLVVEDLEAFRSVHPELEPLLAGEYTGNLGNAGERIVLSDAAGRPILDFAYSDLWHPATDGEGASLEATDPRGPPESFGEAAGWRPSAVAGGTPGRGDGPAGGRRFPSDLNGDRSVDISDAIGLLGHLFLGTAPALPCGSGTLEDPGNRALLDASGDAAVDLTDAIHLLGYLFLSGPPPFRGTGCALIEGCAEACGR